MLVRRKRYTVAAANRLDDFVTEIVLEPRSKPLVYKPGQFVFVSFRSPELRAHQRAVDISLQRQVFSIRAGEISNQFHPFSITSAPGERTLRITVKAIGDYTSVLRRLDEGAEAIVEGPFGSFSNVGPRAAAADLGGGRDRRDAVPQHGAQPRRRRAARPLLLRRRAGRGGALPRRVPRDRGAARRLRGHRRLARSRRVPEADRLAAENPELASSDVLICGPPAMITSLRAQLVAHGLPERQVHAEEFGFAKRGPEAAPPPVELPELREPLPPASRLPAVLFGARVRRVRLCGRRARRAEPLVGRRGCADHVTVDISPAAVAAGKAVYASAACGGCHVLERRAPRGRSGRISTTRSRTPRDVIGVVTNGKGVMPSYRGKLTPRQIEQLAAFVSTSAGPNAAAASS